MPAVNVRKDHLLEVDLLRVVALLAVALIHASAWLVPATSAPTRGPVALAIGLARFCVPVFIFCSGLILYRAYERPADPARFLRRRWLRTLLPWAAWVPVFLAVDLLLDQVTPRPVDVGDWLVYGPGHLYFLVLIAQLYLLLLVVPRGRRALALFTAGAVAVQLALAFFHTYGPQAPGWLAYPVDYLPQVEAPFWAGYFALGCLAGAEYARVRALFRYWPLALVLAVVLGGVVVWESNLVAGDWWRRGSYMFLWPTILPFTLAVAALLLWLGRFLRPHLGGAWRPIRALSKHSLGVYVVHVLVLDELGKLTGQTPNLVRLPLMVAGSLGVAYVIVVLLARTRPGALAVGEEPPRRAAPSAPDSAAASPAAAAAAPSSTPAGPRESQGRLRA